MPATTEQPPATKLSSIAQLLRLIAPYRWRWVCAVIALLFTAGITLTIGQGVRMVIDDGFVAGSASQLQQGIYLLLGLSVLMAGGTFVRFYLVSWLGERVSADIRNAVFNNIVSLSPGYFDNNRSGEIMSRLTTDTTLLQSIVGSSFSLALRSSISTTGALIILVITNLKLTLVILACVPLVLAPILIFGRRVRALSRQSQDSIANVGTYAGEIITQLKTVQSYTREDYEREAFGAEVESAFAIARRRVKQRAVLMAAVIVLVFGALSGMLWVGGNDVLNGTMSAGDLGAFVFYAMLVAMGVATMSEVYGDLQRAVGATDRLVDLMTAKATILPPDSIEVTAAKLAAEVSFKQVNFSYPSRPEQKALDDFSMHIPEGKVVALVGPSGAGKSTVFELMQRFYDPQSGAVLLGDSDIRALSPTDLRQQLGVVSQHPALFSADVSHNIRYGKPDASDEEVQAAARAAYAHDFIEQLPEGYASFLGEQGVRLSGGQKQRIAIARAILKNPRLLLLDEATSALDTHSEQQVQLALETLMQNRTTLIIAHRLSTILHADKIVVMDHGKQVASGTHQQLLKDSELYAKLAAAQFGSLT
ncbi:MAG: ATP-binding cassette domain-containing protein [Gammaproteobacteria bacterium]|nr:ATP-binding cassette domain-containing protein [Gammaproteobacteria bacterium]MBQ0839576.1 ATP-binding cassette domain-containing protein [Gammaproteobacteria bacterium]